QPENFLDRSRPIILVENGMNGDGPTEILDGLKPKFFDEKRREVARNRIICPADTPAGQISHEVPYQARIWNFICMESRPGEVLGETLLENARAGIVPRHILDRMGYFMHVRDARGPWFSVVRTCTRIRGAVAVEEFRGHPAVVIVYGFGRAEHLEDRLGMCID